MKKEEGKLIELLGHPIRHVLLKEILLGLGFQHIPPIDSFGWVFLDKKEQGLHFVFETKENYLEQYGQVESELEPENLKELILKEISFTSTEKNKDNSCFKLPYHLVFGEEMNDIKFKMGSPKDRNKFGGGYVWKYHINGYSYKLFLDENQQLQELKVRLTDLSTHKMIQRNRKLRLHNKYIRAENYHLVLNAIKNSPLKKWERRVEKGKSDYSKDILKNLHLYLIEFIENCSDATQQKKANRIYSAVKKLVKSINKIHKKNNYFIEGRERVELVSFIDQVLLASGFHLVSAEELTMEWRNW